MRTIYKYLLKTVGKQTITLPSLWPEHQRIDLRSQFLHLQEQNGKLYMWCMVDLDAESYEHQIEIIGTGEEITGLSYLDGEELKKHYLGSCGMHNNQLMLHVFLS